MFAGYLKIAWKVLARRRFFTFVSLFGIAFTLTVLIVVAAFVDEMLAPRGAEAPLERSLMLTSLKMFGEHNDWTSGPGWKFLDRYACDLPGVAATTFFSSLNQVANYPRGEKVVSQVRATDAAYWDVLRFRFLEGAPYTADDVAEARQVVVINDATRRTFFADAPAVGRDFSLDGESYRVVGVVANVPQTAQVAYADVWRPHSTIRSASWHRGLMGGCNGVFLLAPGVAAAVPQSEFQTRLGLVEFDQPDAYNSLRGRLETRLEATARELFWTQPGGSSVGRFIAVFAGGALLFMLLPAINLVNINLSRLHERASEIGVRKAFGASSRDLVGQFILENVVLCLLGALVAVPAAAAVLEWIESLGLMAYLDLRINGRLLLAGAALAAFFGVLSGAWPAYRMSRQHPVACLRGGGR